MPPETPALRGKAADAPRRYTAPALEKGLDILELLASNDQPMTASQIAAALDRSISELFRMIQVLEYRGYILPRSAGDGYELSNKLFTLGMSRAPVQTLLEAALPVMRDLSDAVRQSCHLAVASEAQMVVIARVENPGYLGFSVRPGYRRRLDESGSGTALFAFQPSKVRAAWAEHLSSSGIGQRALVAFQKRADAVFDQGYERTESDFVMGVTDLSCPVLLNDAAVAALTVPYLASSTSQISVDEVLARLILASRLVTDNLAASS